MRNRKLLPAVLGSLALLATLLVAAVGAPPASAAPGPAPLITFYVPLPEDAYMEALRSIDTGSVPPAPGTTARTTITITAASANGIIYYDQWENGFEPTINDPLVTTGAGRTLVWGDNDPSNGDVSTFCPRCGGADVIPAGGVITLNNTRLPDGTGTQAFAPGPVTTPRNASTVLWDGRDKIAGTRGLTVANIGWGQADALASGAVAALDTNRWGLRYVVPIGQNSPNPNGGAATAAPTEYTAITVMAKLPNTNVLIDGNADGDFIDAVDRNVVLDEGEYEFVDGGILQGAQIIADKPVQADLYGGDDNADYEVSFLELIPINGFNTDYIAPAAAYEADQATVVYLYNPAPTALNVTKQTSSGSTVIAVPAGGTVFTLLNTPLGGAARFTAATPFLASAIMGAASASNSARYDWGYAPVPTSYLTPSLVVGWAPGSQDLSDVNASPVWITSTQNTTVYVDFDGDPATGANFLPNTGVCSSANRYDVTRSVPALSATRITDTDGDMTGARISTCDLNVKIAAAYGEDPAQALDGSGNPTGQPGAQGAAAGFPGLDLGTAQFPAPGLLIGKASALVVDVNGDGTVDPGDTVQWTATMADLSATALSNLVATDDLPAGLAYVPNSTTLTVTGSPTVAVPDSGSGTPFPLDGAGFYIGNIPPAGTVTLVYRTVITNPPPSSAVTIENILCGAADQAADCGSGGTPVDQPAVISDRVWADTDADGIQDGGETGVSGVTVNLYLDANKDGVADGGVVQTTTTNGSGLYSFTVDPTPNYIVEFVRPAGQYLTLRDQGADEAVDSDPDRSTGRTATIDPAPGQVITYVDAGLVPAASIGDRVWEDTDGDGIQDAGETTGVSGVTVNLFLDTNNDGVPDGPAIATTTTNGSGTYGFSDLDPNVNYVVEFVAPGGRTFSPIDQGGNDNTDSDASTTTGRTATINPAPGQAITNVDAGLLPPSITILKTSSAGGTVTPGEVFAYTITVTNTGVAALTNVVVSDTLPAGLTWNSTGVQAPGNTTLGTLADNFEPAPASYARSNGTLTWAGNWIEAGDTGGAANSGGTQVASDGSDQALRFQDGEVDTDDTLTRAMGNRTGVTSGTVAFDYVCSTLEAGDSIRLEISPNNSTWRTLATYNGNSNCGSTSASLPLVGTDFGADTRIRWYVNDGFSNGGGDTMFVDNIVITLNQRTTPPYTSVPGANPSPGPLTTIASLLPGETATITVNVTAADPFPGGTTGFTNTACADPDQTGPVCDDVTDGVAPGVISDFVWDDYDLDGVQDAGEPGRDGVTVELYDSTGTTLLQSTTTAGGGLYSFTVTPGTYTVRFVAPTNTAFTLQDQGGDTTDSDANPSTGRTGGITVASGQTRTDVDAGLIGTGSIGDTIFWDRDGDNAFDAGEGLAGVDVTLLFFGPNGVLGGGDDVTYTTTTAGDGQYLFSNLPPGTFRVTVDTADLPPGVTTNTVDPDGGNNSTSQLTLAAGQSNLLQDFGYVGSGSIGDTIFWDRDGDNTFDAGEGVPGVDVTVVWFGPNGTLGGGDDITFTTTTTGDGQYLFSQLPAGTFQVTVDTADLPPGVATNTVDPDGGNDSTSQVTLTTGQSNLLQDFGYVGSGSIGDTIFWDRDGDNVFDAGEGLAGVDVTLTWFGPNGTPGGGDDVVLTTTTAGDGQYLFSNLPAGTFSVAVDTADLPPGVTTNTVDPDGGNDSTSQVTLATGEDNVLQDFGYVGSGSIGDTIFWDRDGDDVFDAGEGLAGVDVTLTWFGPNGTLGGGDDVTFTTTTAGDGQYLFSNLPAGTFTVAVDTADLPPGVTTNTVDPDGGNDSTSEVTLATGQSNLLQDFGYVGTGSIGDTIWEDVDDDGTFDAGEGLAGVDVVVTWFGPNGTAGGGDDITFTTTTAGDGQYLVGGLPAGTFRVDVTTATLPPALTINVVDPDGGNDSTSQLTLATGEDNLLQDFAYRRPNSPPSLGADVVAVCSNGTTNVAVLPNDSDTDLDSVTIVSVSPSSSAGGTVVLSSGVVSYTPPVNFTGVDVFTYTATDGYGGSSTTTVSMVLSADCLIRNDRMFTFGLGGATGPGSAPGQYDRITSGGAVRFSDQQIVLSLRDGFVPQPGDTFDIWVGGSVSGFPAQIYGQVMPNGVVLEARVLGDRLQLVARQGLIVTTAADLVDTNPGDGVCRTATLTGACSLRAAVQEANALPGHQAIIGLARSTMGLSIAGQNEDLAATGDLDLTGELYLFGQGGTVDANEIDRALDVRIGASVGALRLKVVGGSTAGSGGGVRVGNAGLVLDDVEVRDSLTTSSGSGGLLSATTSSSLVIRGSWFSGGGADNLGGGLQLNATTATIESSVIEQSTANSGGGGIEATNSNLTVRATTFRENEASGGGGLRANGGTVSLTNTTFRDNVSTSTGGAIARTGAGTLTLTDSRVLLSVAVLGGGLYNDGHTVVDRTTFDVNQGTTGGGAIYSSGTLEVRTSTISTNSSPAGAGVRAAGGTVDLVSVTMSRNGSFTGGTLNTAGATATTMRNSVVADQNVGTNCASGSVVTSGGFNHASDTTCGLAGTGDVQGTTANLGNLAPNGGYGPSHRPATGSPVINSGGTSSTICGARDQRNFPRPRGGACEKGSFEL